MSDPKPIIHRKCEKFSNSLNIEIMKEPKKLFMILSYL